ncbi:hypothetical protein BDD12DRAFT_888389 [Trichophaea hybrida]|nr:hypothetical protein BDD12DRAFT_888389 [Trichophaea hybrida]
MTSINTTTANPFSSTKDQATADAIQARIDVSVSKARSVVASWFPTTNLANEDSDTDEELFKPVPPRQAFVNHPRIGAPIPANFCTQVRAGKDTLRRNMLGGRKPTKEIPETVRLHNRNTAQADDSEEDTGRSALGGYKRKKQKPASDLRRAKVARTETLSVKIPTLDIATEIKTEAVAGVLQSPILVLESSDVALSSKKKNKKRKKMSE